MILKHFSTYLIIFIYFSLFVASCTDVIVPNISKDKVLLITPIDSLTTTQQNQSFKWEELNFADSYNLQIASPNFDLPLNFIVDTIINNTSFNLTLNQGVYQWSVTGLNPAYQTIPAIHDLVISDTSSVLTGQTFSLISPSNNVALNKNEILFQWETLSNAEGFRFQLSDDNFISSIKDTFLIDNRLSLSFYDDNQFSWRVRAENNLSSTFTSWITSNFSTDYTSPLPPIINFPTNMDTLSLNEQNPDFKWTVFEDTFKDSIIFLLSPLDIIPYNVIEGENHQANVSSNDLFVNNDTIIDLNWFIRIYDNAENFIDSDTILTTIKN